jgi:hypothetical protein|tara:strand:- start:2170 stop:3150 length:981 start_codon:yes stop_codon:yes gene_type:complete
MAILRGGKRIGGYDIRIGIPRDRSLDNVTGDPRLKRTQGGNPESTMGRVQAMVNEAEGFARKARFYVEFHLPKSLPGDINGGVGNVSSTMTDETYDSFFTAEDMNAMHIANAKRVQAFCSAIEMPDREIVTKEVRHGNAPPRNVAYDMKTQEITATFYADKFLRERSYFEAWQSAAFSNKSYNLNYFKNYVTDMRIYQLGSFESRQERDEITYGVQLMECLPTSISKVEYSHDENQVQTFSVTFKFTNWINFFLDKSGNIELGQSQFSTPTVKQDSGLLGGLLGKLPPELRRAGRDVLNDLRRRVPLGKITGGRAFPPFKLPPINI